MLALTSDNMGQWSAIQATLEALPRTKAEAKAAGAVHFFTGRPCSRGHLAAALTATGRCCQCVEVAAQAKAEEKKRVARQATAKERAARERKQERAWAKKAEAEEQRRKEREALKQQAREERKKARIKAKAAATRAANKAALLEQQAKEAEAHKLAVVATVPPADSGEALPPPWEESPPAPAGEPVGTHGNAQAEAVSVRHLKEPAAESVHSAADDTAPWD